MTFLLIGLFAIRMSTQIRTSTFFLKSPQVVIPMVLDLLFSLRCFVVEDLLAIFQLSYVGEMEFILPFVQQEI